jgi:hypothetical protein
MAGRLAQHGQAGGDLGKGVIVDVTGLVGQRVPGRRAEDLRGLLAVVGQEGHQGGDRPQVQVHFPG